MTVRSWIRKMFDSPSPRTIRKAPARIRLSLEALEDRVVPAVSFNPELPRVGLARGPEGKDPQPSFAAADTLEGREKLPPPSEVVHPIARVPRTRRTGDRRGPRCLGAAVRSSSCATCYPRLRGYGRGHVASLREIVCSDQVSGRIKR